MGSQRLHVSIAALAAVTVTALGLLGACGGGSEDERGSIGVPPSAPPYCTNLGYTVVGDNCTFPDGTSCEQWAFYRGECGQSHSYCNLHGGSVASQTVDAGTFTTVSAVCTLNGRQCDEATFMATGHCP
jgi:putative hemolysin